MHVGLLSLMACVAEPEPLVSGSYVPENPEDAPVEGVNLNVERSVASFLVDGTVYGRDLVASEEEDWPLRCGDLYRGGLPEELVRVDGDPLPGVLDGEMALSSNCRDAPGLRIQWPGLDVDPINLVPFDPGS